MIRDDVLLRMIEEVVEMAMRLARGRAARDEQEVQAALATALRLEGLDLDGLAGSKDLKARVPRDARLRVAWLLAQAATGRPDEAALRRLAAGLVDDLGELPREIAEAISGTSAGTGRP